MSLPTPSDSPDKNPEDLARRLEETTFRLNQKIVQLETLHQAGLALAASLQVEEVMGESMLLAVGMVDAHGGFLFLKEGTGNRLALARHTNLSPEQIVLLSNGPVHDELQLAMTRNIPSVFGPDDLPDDLEIQFMLVVPVSDLGFIGVVDKESRSGIQSFTEGDGHLLDLMAQQAGSALANARLYRNMVEEKNLTQSILGSIADGLVSTDLAGKIVRVNPAALRIFSDEEDFLGRSSVKFFELYGCERIAQAVSLSLSDGRERRIENEQGEQDSLSLNAHVTPLLNETNAVQGVVVALEDLTPQTRIQSMFKQYASDQVVDLLLSADTQPALGGEQRVATMLFVDLVGSTELLDQIGPEEMVDLLNDCFTRLVDIVFDYNGTLDKYMGDGFLAVFGVPVTFSDDSKRAVRSALAIRSEMRRFSEENQQNWGISIGISRGSVVAGNIGSLRRMEYTVIGPDVNLAARLCDKARSGEILVSSIVQNELQDEFEFGYLGPQLFKGTRETIEVYELLGLQGTPKSAPIAVPTIEPQTQAARVELSIPMLPQMELTASQTAEAVGAFMNLAEEKVEEVKLALIEACINAFEHSQAKDRRLQIDLEAGEKELVVKVSDRGHGFDIVSVREDLDRRRSDGNKKRGWGLELMRQLMDEVDLQSGSDGTTITLVKRR